MNFFQFKNKDGFVTGVIDLTHVISAHHYQDGEYDVCLFILMASGESISIKNEYIDNLAEFFNAISNSPTVESKDDRCGDCKPQEPTEDQTVGITQPESITPHGRYHVVFNGNTAKTIVLYDIHTLYINSPTQMTITNRIESLPSVINYENYGNIFEKLPSYYYVINDLFAFSMIDILTCNVEKLEDDLYQVSITYCDNPTRSISHKLAVEDDRIIHMLGVINNF